MSHTDNLKETL